jgi:hypothetical protein
MTRRKNVASILAITVIAGALTCGVLASAAQAALKHFDGTVVSKNPAAKTFKITTQGGGKVTFKVNGKTVFERVGGGFGALTKGMQIQVDAVQTTSGLVAKKVEPQGSGGGGQGGGNDGPNHM